MPVTSVLRLNMTGLDPDPEREAARYEAALDMAEYCEANGFSVVSVEEHHCAENGWLPSPLTMAGALIGRTRKMSVNVTALLVTLYDPLRLAEDIAVLDLLSKGRLSFVAGLGYRPVEYHAMDKRWEDRGRLMDEVVGAMLKAWTGEPFEYKGQTVRITPVPYTRPHPTFFIGGMSPAAARRAARFGLPFYPPMKMPELEKLYYAELEKHGHKGFVYYPDQENSMLFVDPDPESAWQELAPHFLRETQEYSQWKQEGVPRPSEQETLSIEDLREQKRYEILTPDECVERILGRGNSFISVMHPLAGGIPVERAWKMLKLYVDEVLPRVS
jgi:alkanesulfonate monooxygenase SsuD/methylene tetrahydromethanopterin reductase-like flavin-dependent oxidoreductase (luciferase family)